MTLEMKARGWVQNGVSVFGHGAAFADISGDSLPDLYISNAVRGAAGKIPETLYISRAGQAYSEEDGLRGVSDSHGLTGTHGIVYADYDNDGDLDIFNATTDDRIRLYRNRGDGYFTDYSDAANIVPARVSYPTYGYVGYGTRGIVLFDADNDGDLDLYGVNWGPTENYYAKAWETPAQPNEFYLNNGDGTFTKDDTRGLTPINPSNEGTQGVVALDIDNDDDMDVFVCHRNYAFLGYDQYGNELFGPGLTPTPNDLFLNDGTGHFIQADVRERGLYNDTNDCNATTFADYDNDGDLDAFVVPKFVVLTNKKKLHIKVYQNDGKGFFRNVSDEAVLEQWGYTCFIFDVDNDGYLDAFTPVTYGYAGFYRNNQLGGFIRLDGVGLNVEAYDPRGGAIADIDYDGDLDIYIVDANKHTAAQYSNRLFRNESVNSNKWVKIWGSGPKGDLGAFGTKIWVFEKGHMDNLSNLIGYKQIINSYGYISQDDIVQHFGIGFRDSVDVKIKMLDGTLLKIRMRNNSKFYFSKPQTIAKLEGDNQTDQSGTTLPIPFKIRVQDAKGKAVAGVAMNFEVVDGNGRFVESIPVYTNRAGIAQVHYILGSMAGEHRIRVSSASMSGVETEFVATALNIGPSEMELISGSNQSAFAGSVLDDSIRVRVINSSGVGQSGHPVHFEVLAGNGKLKPGDVQILERNTNDAGYVAVAWQMGPAPGEAQTLRISSWANYEPLIGSPIELQATALERPQTAGKPKDLLYMGGNDQTATVGRLLPDPFVVQLVDSVGRGCPDYDVIFRVTAGGGLLAGADQQRSITDREGMASVQLRLGTLAGANKHQVKANYLGISKEIIFTASAVADTPAVMIKKPEGDNQLTNVGQTLPKPLAVQVTDMYGNSIAGHPVSFSVTSSDGWINDQKTISVITDAAGNAQALLRFGKTPGVYTVSVSTLYHNRALENSPAIFTATAVSLPAFLLQISADSTFGVAGQLMPEPLRVRVTDDLGYPIPNYTVNFIVRRGGGTIDSRTEVLTMTDLNGVASVTPTLGSSVGANNNIFEAQAYKEAGKNLQGSPKKYYVSAKKSLAAVLEKVSGDGLAAQAGDYLPQPLVARVLDHLSRPVAGHDVTFKVIAGGGKLGKTQLNIITIKTDNNGLAQVTYRLGNQLGGNAHAVEVSSNDGITHITQSPAYFYASSPYGLPDVVRSQMTVQSPVVANGVDECLVTIRLVDEADNPVPNERVTLLVQGNGNLISQPELPTDANGETIAILRSTLAEEKTLRAYVVNDEVYLQQQATVQFMAGPPSRIYLEQGNYQNGIINSALEEPMGVRIFDTFDNSIVDADVYFLPFPGCGRVEPAEKMITDVDGRAHLNWILGPSIGLQQLQVRVVGMAATENFSAYASAPSEVTVTRHKGDGQFATVGSIFSDSLIVQVVNGHQSPIFGLDVTFSVMQGDAVISGLPTVKSDSYGLARARLVAGETIGAVKVRAAVDQSHYVDFYCAVSTSLPEKMTPQYGDGLSAMVTNRVYPLSVRVTDMNNNPVANVPIHFIPQTDGGSIEEAQPLLTDNDGLASATAKLGTKAGEYIFSASNASLAGSPTLFRLIALPAAASRIHIYEGNNQAARALQPLASPIKVRMCDPYDNGIGDQEVSFDVISGGGSVYPLIAGTDAQGVAATTWQLGPFGVQEVKASSEMLVGQSVIFSAVVIENIPPVIRCLSDTTILETQTLVFDVEAVDPDGSGAMLSCMNMPTGATFDGLHTNLFIWRPEFTQQGVYVVIFRAVDDDGGESQKAVTIRVQNLNRPPVIFSYSPEYFYVSTAAFKPMQFQAQASDQDGDSLRYTWTMDHHQVGKDKKMTIFPTPNMPTEFIVSVTVDDKVDSVTQAWMVKLETGVELSSFRVEAVQGCNCLTWTCRFETNHLGFNLLRSQTREGGYEKINDGFLAPRGASGYSYIDRPANTSIRYFYQLQAVAADGNEQLFGPVEAAPQIPNHTRLAQNFPNPFNPVTTIQFESDKPQLIEIHIYNMSGQLVKALYRRNTSAGYHRIDWDGCSDWGVRVPSGIYYCILRGQDVRQRIKLLLLK
ncbi:Ig-like domain-containing protein [candidate division KSB1 bacterium]|nr:Ig-like domain-containing protein [candidate division KSB1 bacterium]